MAAGPAAASPAATGPAPRAAAGAIGLRLVDAPNGANDPRAQLYIVDRLAPGTVVHRRIELTNTTAVSTAIELYAAAASIADGSFLGAAGHTQNDVSTWTSVAPGERVVPAGAKVTATVSIAVPRDAAPGEQYGAVWAEARSASPPGAGVTQVSRVGIRMYLSIGPGGAPAADFTIDSLTAKRAPGGQPLLVASVHNTGGRALDMNGTVQLASGPGGLSAGPFAAALGVTLGVGDTEPVSVTLDKRLPAGPWNARVTLRSGLVERTADATVTFPAEGASAPVRTTTPRRSWPYPALAGGLVVLVSLAALLLRRRAVRG